MSAAVDVGRAAGYENAKAVLIREKNNVVVWLAPHQVVAKVGIWGRSSTLLAREVEVCAQLAVTGAPAARPIGSLTFDSASGLPVSLWRRLESSPDASCSTEDLAEMLRRVHAALRTCSLELPSFLDELDHTRTTLFDDDRMAALPRSDLALLRAAFESWVHAARDSSAIYQPLHGEPNHGNVVVTANGPRLVDFERVCLGPLEWDLALMEARVGQAFDDVDRELVALLRLLNHARMATWSWARADRRSRRSRRRRLDIVRRAFRS